jgi:hypothetical protein
MAEYGDMYPDGDRWGDPESYLTPQQVGELAVANAEALLAKPVLNLDAAEMHMRAFAGLFNGLGNLDTQTYNRLSTLAKAASQETADSVRSYFDAIGRQAALIHDMHMAYRNGPSQRDQDSYLINAMQVHTSIAARHESAREMGVLRRGLLPYGSPLKQHKSLSNWEYEDPQEAEALRLSLPDPYSVFGIRGVLKVFGRNLGPVIESFAEIAPLDIDRRTIVHHATESLRAAGPNRE